MPLPDKHDSVVVLGPRESGKSTLIKAFLFNEPRCIGIDSSRGIHMAYSVGPIVSDTGMEHVSRRGPLRLIVDATKRPKTALQTASMYAMRAGPYEKVLFFADELGDAVSHSKKGFDVDGDEESNPFQLVVRQGRHYGIKVLVGVQRSADIPRIVTANSQDWYIFHSWEPRDRQYARMVLGDDLPPLPLHVAAHIRKGSIVGYVKVINGEAKESQRHNPES